MPGTVTIKDRGLAALLKRTAAAARPVTLTVGIHEEQGAGSHGAATIADIAAMTEFGLGQPARSFIGAWADEREGEHKAQIRKLGEAVVKGTVTAPQGFEQLGQKYVGEVQARIAGGIAPPNAPSTIAKKGSSTPLIDQGVLRSSITSKVEAA